MRAVYLQVAYIRSSAEYHTSSPQAIISLATSDRLVIVESIGYCIEIPELLHQPMPTTSIRAMSMIIDFCSRDIDQEPDTAAILPDHQDYFIIGTYHLNEDVKAQVDQVQNPSDQPLRGGSIQILPYSISPNTSEGCQPLARKDFSCAIVDLHFHPEDGTLLGAATSTGGLRFFRILTDCDNPSQNPIFNIAELGNATTSEDIDAGSAPLVTYFSWLPGFTAQDEGTSDATKAVMLAACDTNGDTKIVRVKLPMLGHSSSREDSPQARLTPEVDTIHTQQHNLEAWIVTRIPLQPSDLTRNSSVILTGGDDSNIIGSKLALDLDHEFELLSSSKSFKVRDQHTAGVTSILALDEIKPDFMPILTGSYDDTIRLFMLRPSMISQGFQLVTSADLGGGVWRIILLDQYKLSSGDRHWTLLICAMYDGAKIVRLVASPVIRDQQPSDNMAGYTWTFEVEAMFKAGHESMVYAAIAKPLKDSSSWHIITTSFYDRKVCNWYWQDVKKPVATTI